MGGALRRKRAGLDEWAGRITACLNRTVEGIFSTGEELTRAKDALPRGQWEQLFEPNADGVRRVPMSIVTAQRFMAVYRAKDRLLPKASHGTFLPPSWRTLWELQALPEDTLTWALEHGKVRPDMERKHVAALKAEFGGTPPAPSKRGRREYSDLQIRLSELVQREFKQWPDGDATAFQDALLLQVNMFTPLTNRRAEYVETRD